MRRPRLGWIGIDLGGRAIKLAQVERQGTHVRLHRGIVVPRADAGLGDGLAASVEAVPSAEEIQAALSSQLGFHGNTAACIVPMTKGDLRALTIPDGPPLERRAIVANELSAVFGSAADDRDFDYWETQMPGEP